eukprot:1156295-Pelagomonas_calceolata.AAC.13
MAQKGHEFPTPRNAGAAQLLIHGGGCAKTMQKHIICFTLMLQDPFKEIEILVNRVVLGQVAHASF